jgi:hypothetical protein
MLGDRAKLMEAYGKPLLDSAVRAQFIRRASVVYGLIFGLGFAVVLWLPDALQLQRASVYLAWAKLPVGLILCASVGALTGWVATRMRWSFFTLLSWAAGGAVMAWIAGHVPYEGLNLIAGLDAANALGATTHPFYLYAAGLTGIGIIVGLFAGFFAGLVQFIVVEWAWDRSTRSHRIGFRSILALSVCLPIAAIFAAYTDTVINVPIRKPVVDVAWLFERLINQPASLTRPEQVLLERYRSRTTSDYTVYWAGTRSLSGNEDLADIVDVVFSSGLAIRCNYIAVMGDGVVQNCTEVKP